MSKQSELREAIYHAEKRAKLATERDRDNASSNFVKDRRAEHAERQRETQSRRDR